MEGTEIGQYRLISPLRRGGVGDVWRAVDTTTGRTVALKLLPPHLTLDVSYAERFRREAEAIYRLSNPHITRINTYGEVDGRLFVDMQLIEGQDLETLLQDGPLSVERAVEMVEQIASALDDAHRAGVVHRDVKPSNVLLDEDGVAYLINFGVARGLDKTGLTGDGSVVDTWDYIAPERLTKGESDPRGDVYSLTCVFYECLTGTKPFAGDTLEQQMAAHISAPPPRPSLARNDIPEMLDRVVATGMAKNPLDRFASTVELGRAARHALTPVVRPTEPVLTATPPPMAMPAYPSQGPPSATPTPGYGPRADQVWGYQQAGAAPTTATRSRTAVYVAIAVIAIVLVIAIVAAMILTADSDETAGAGAAVSSTTPTAVDVPAPVGGPECAVDPAVARNAPTTDPLKIGSLLPETGVLSVLGPAMTGGAQLAVDEINEAGGVLGKQVELLTGDSGDASTGIAGRTVDRHLDAGVDVIVGAASNAVSLNVIDKIVDAGVVQISPSNTSNEFTCYEDEGLYFRTSPSDALQARALAWLMHENGARRFAIIAVGDDYGTAMADNAVAALEALDVAPDDILQLLYPPDATSFDADVDEIAGFNPDAVAVIGPPESAGIVDSLHQLGIGPSDGVAVYGTDANMGDETGEGLPRGALEGMQGTLPIAAITSEFAERLSDFIDTPGGFDIFSYAGETYDAVIVSALAAEQAKSTAGVDIAAAMTSVTRDGTTCATFGSCRDLIEQGHDIDYDGVTGPLRFDAAGDVTVGSFAVVEFGPDNRLLAPVDEQSYVVVGR